MNSEAKKMNNKTVEHNHCSCEHDLQYDNPLISRYASKEMNYLFSSEFKFITWRHLWLSLAKNEKKLGINITDEQIKDLEKYVDTLNLDVAIEKEKEIRHDVMSHIYAYGEQAKKAKGIIHLGATSCFVGDNTDIITMRYALIIVKMKLIQLIKTLSKFANSYKQLPTLSYTHFQPAQPTTVGRRACLWLYDFYNDFVDLEYIIDSLKFLGCKGTTGTQASFLKLFNGNHNKCKKLDLLIAKDFNFDNIVKISGQTYSRKEDYRVLEVLAGISQTAHKFSNDLRLLQHMKEIEEPFETAQVGSSAMPYKRNPMRCERIASLSNFVISLLNNTMMTSSTQWFERTLDDSANRRLTIPQAFLTIDGVLSLCINVCDGLVVNKKVIENNLLNELPFMITEDIMMQLVKNGKDRQEVHEKIRKYSQISANNVKQKGEKNNLIELLLNDKYLELNKDVINKILNDKSHIGRSAEQVDEFLEEVINPLLKKYKNIKNFDVKITV